MSDIEKVRLFDNQKIRTVWVEEEEEWYFSVRDVVTILTDTTNAKDYISKMKRRDEELSKGWGQIVHPPLQSRFLDKTLPGKPNRVLSKYKVAFIVNGFWARAQRPKVCYTAYYPLLS